MSFEILHEVSTTITRFLERVPFEPREETLTEMLLTELKDRIPGFQAEKQTTGQEAKNGADFILHLNDGLTETVLYVQAKRLFDNGRYLMLKPHKDTAKRQQQPDLIREAVEEARQGSQSKVVKPLYLFFNSPLVSPFNNPTVTLSGTQYSRDWAWSGTPNLTIPQSPMGITLCSYRAVVDAIASFRAASAMKKVHELHAGKFLTSSIPFEHLFEPASALSRVADPDERSIRLSSTFSSLISPTHDPDSSTTSASSATAMTPPQMQMVTVGGVHCVVDHEGQITQPSFYASLAINIAERSVSEAAGQPPKPPNPVAFKILASSTARYTDYISGGVNDLDVSKLTEAEIKQLMLELVAEAERRAPRGKKRGKTLHSEEP